MLLGFSRRLKYSNPPPLKCISCASCGLLADMYDIFNVQGGFTQNQNLSSKPWDWKFPEVTLSGLAVMEFTFSYHIYIYIYI